MSSPLVVISLASNYCSTCSRKAEGGPEDFKRPEPPSESPPVKALSSGPKPPQQTATSKRLLVTPLLQLVCQIFKTNLETLTGILDSVRLVQPEHPPSWSMTSCRHAGSTWRHSRIAAANMSWLQDCLTCHIVGGETRAARPSCLREDRASMCCFFFSVLVTAQPQSTCTLTANPQEGYFQSLSSRLWSEPPLWPETYDPVIQKG